MLPQKLKNFQLFVSGVGYAGRVDEVNLPKVTVKMEEWRPGGQDSPIELDMGLEKMESTWQMGEYNSTVVGTFGKISGQDTGVTFRGALQRQGIDAVPVTATLRGRVKELDPGNIKAGDANPLKFQMAVNYYKLNINGVDAIEIDVVNMIRNINGFDEMASLRAAIGL